MKAKQGWVVAVRLMAAPNAATEGVPPGQGWVGEGGNGGARYIYVGERGELD